MPVDVFAVGADEAGERDDGVVDPELESLAEQPLRELDERALAQVVGAGLEREADEADAAEPGGDDGVDDPPQVPLVRRQHALEQRHLDVGLPGRVDERTQILGQARAAEGEARLQVGGRDVQLRVADEDVHHVVGVETEGSGDDADLVREADLQRVEGVVGVLDHLRDAQRHAIDRRLDPLVERRDRVPARLVVLPDHGLGRVEEVGERAALAEELRVHREPEPVARFEPRLPGDRRADERLRRAGQAGRAQDDRVPSRSAAREAAPDRHGHPLDRVRPEAAVRPRRGPDADQREVGLGHGPLAVARGAEPAGAALGRDEIGQPRLQHRALAALDRGHLPLARVDREHLVAA